VVYQCGYRLSMIGKREREKCCGESNLPGEKSLTNLKLRPTQPFKKRKWWGIEEVPRWCLYHHFISFASSISVHVKLLSSVFHYDFVFLHKLYQVTNLWEKHANLRYRFLVSSTNYNRTNQKNPCENCKKSIDLKWVSPERFLSCNIKIFINLKRCWSLTQLN
jgi:hypothetical protein